MIGTEITFEACSHRVTVDFTRWVAIHSPTSGIWLADVNVRMLRWFYTSN
jgi:hypothetical protein